MESYLQKNLYVYRRSYKYYFKIGLFLSILKIMLNISGVSGIYYLPLILIGLLSSVVEILEKTLNINERIESYKFSYKFYKQLLHYYRAQKLNEDEINLREHEFNNNLNFFPLEKYLKESQLNGYNIDVEN